MKKIRILLLIIPTILMHWMSFGVRYGVVIIPVADLVGSPLGSAVRYHHLPWAARGSDYAACPRIHQLLFHEVVEILDEQQDEIKVRIPNLFYQTANQRTPQTDYWTTAAAIKALDTISSYEQRKLPQPIRFNRRMHTNQPIVTLKAPYYDPTTNMTFSAGTRFVRTTRKGKKSKVPVYCFDPQKGTCAVISIPQKLFYQKTRTNPDRQRDDFIQILRSWAHQASPARGYARQAAPGIVPYVWGGCSFTQTVPENRFTSVITKQGGYYERPGNVSHKTGFDCVGLIARAAQIVGLPYYLKNSYTIANNLTSTRQDEHLHQGDIIWIAGHVMVVSDLKKNLVIEAHAYGSGYGRVHELPIHRIFKGIDTIAALEHAYHVHQALERLNSAGRVFARYPQWKLLKIPTH